MEKFGNLKPCRFNYVRNTLVSWVLPRDRGLQRLREGRRSARMASRTGRSMSLFGNKQTIGAASSLTQIRMLSEIQSP
jgi:hypothetical protein